MRTKVITVTPNTTYEETAMLMHKHNFSGLPVVDKNSKLAGIISEKDLFKALYPRYEEYLADRQTYRDQEAQEKRIKTIRNNPIKMYMKRKVITLGPDAPILRAGGIMLARGIHGLPVVEKDKLIGIVTREEIYSAIMKRHFGF